MQKQKRFQILFSFQFLIIVASIFLLGSSIFSAWGDVPWDPGDEQMRIVDPGDDIGSPTLGAATGTVLGQAMLAVIALLSIMTFALNFSLYKKEAGFSGKAKLAGKTKPRNRSK